MVAAAGLRRAGGGVCCVLVFEGGGTVSPSLERVLAGDVCWRCLGGSLRSARGRFGVGCEWRLLARHGWWGVRLRYWEPLLRSVSLLARVCVTASFVLFERRERAVLRSSALSGSEVVVGGQFCSETVYSFSGPNVLMPQRIHSRTSLGTPRDADVIHK
jgi:hypothetical protein